MSAPLDKLFVREFERKDGSILKINQSEIGDVGCVVWDAALVLAKYFETNDFHDIGEFNILQGKRVLELGSGTGLVGLQCSCLGADVTITDLPDFLPLMEVNIQTNIDLIKGKLEAKSLTWGKDEKDFLPSPDYLLIADCIYYEESLEPLVNTIVTLTDKNTIVLCCYEERTTGNKPQLQRKFFEGIKAHFDVEEISHERQDSTFQSPDIHIMIFKKR